MVPPSLNVQRRMSQFVYRDLRNSWQRTIYALIQYDDRKWLEALALQGIKMYLDITVEHIRIYDKDNLYGACKPVIDCIKNLKLIRNDSPEHVELTVTQEKSHENCTRIRLARVL
jgi:hypothetical protein